LISVKLDGRAGRFAQYGMIWVEPSSQRTSDLLAIVTGFIPPLFSTPLAGGYAEDAYRAMLVLMATALGIGIGIAIYSTVRWM
jgi:hypothetical protein